MSDMSFKQASQIAERLELSELTLKKTLTQVEKATMLFEKKSQTKNDNKILKLQIMLGINVGFIIGLLVAKYFL